MHQQTMRSTKQFSITLPIDMADAVKAMVAAGQYATESEVIREGLRALAARDQAIDSWLCSEVAATYDTLKADPLNVLSADEVRAALSAHHERSRTKT
jgi:antitoxin ParD1/3/4